MRPPRVSIAALMTIVPPLALVSVPLDFAASWSS